MISKVKEKCLEDKVNGIMKSSTKYNKKAELKTEDTNFTELIKVLYKQWKFGKNGTGNEKRNHQRNNTRKFLRIWIF